MGIFGNGYANATAQAEKLAIAGSVTLLFFTNDSEEHIQSGVKINQGPFLNHNATADNIFTMFAENAEQLVFGAGQIKPAATVDPKGSTKSPGGAGGSFAGLVLNQTTQSIIAPNVTISTGAKGGTYVEVEELVMQIGLATSGAAADSTSVSGAVTLFDQTSNNLAQVDTGAHITGGLLEVFSESFEAAIGGAGDITTGHGVGIGVSISIALINRNTASVLGSTDLAAPGNGGTNINTAGVTVEAENGGVFWTGAVAGTVVTKEESKKEPETGTGGHGSKDDPIEEDDPLDGISLPLLFGEDPVSQGDSSETAPADKPQAKTGAAIAGAAVINFATDKTLAYINDLGTIDPGADGAVDVSASQKTDVQGGAGAIAFDKGAGSKTNIAFAGALSLNVVNDTTRALIVGATIPEGGELTVEATREGKVDVGTIGAAGSTAGGRSFGIAGSVSWQQITAVTEAIVTDVIGTFGGAGEITAKDNTSEIAIGGGIGYGGGVGIGASIAVNEITQHTRAIVDGSTLTFGDSYEQTATDGFDVIAVGVSAGIGQSAVAFTIAINLGTSSAEATLTNATITTQNAGDITIAAYDTSTIETGVGAIALGVLAPSKDANSPSKSSAHLAIGISIAVNSIDQQVPVTLTDSVLNAFGKVELEASSVGSSIYAVGVAGGATFRGSGSSSNGFQFAGAGVIMINSITGSIDVTTTNGSLTSGAGSDVSLKAEDGTSINADAGAASILVDLNKAPDPTDIAIGAAVAVNNDDRTIKATTSATTLDSGGAIDVSATSSATITTFALGIAGAVQSGGTGGFAFAGAGSGAGSTITQTLKALISGGSVTADDGISVTAKDQSAIDTEAGGIAITVARGPPNALAVGLSVAVNTIVDNVTAEIKDASSVSGSTLDIDAEVTSSKINAWTIAGALAVKAGGTGSGITFSGAGAGSGNHITDTVLAQLSNVSTVTLTDAGTPASITASDSSQIFAVAGSAALGISYGSGSSGNVSVGAAAAVNTINNSVHAIVDGVPDFETPGGLEVTATESATVEAITIGVAGSISGGSGSGFAFAGAGSGSGNSITTNTEAEIQSSSVTTADSTGDPTSAAVEVEAHDTGAILAISGALGLSGKFGSGTNGSVAVGVSIAINNVTPTVLAEISGSSVTTAGGITVTATSVDGDTPGQPNNSTDNGMAPGIHAFSLGGAVAVAAGSGTNISGAVGGGFAFNTIGGSTTATIDGGTISAGGDVEVSGTDSRTIDATTFAGAVSISGGSSTSVGISIGLSIAQNTITSSLEASIDSANVTDAASLSVTATDSASITSTVSAVAVSVAVGSNGVAIGGGGAVALNEINTTTNAFVLSSTLGSSDAPIGAVSIGASSTGSIDAFVLAVSASVAVGDSNGVGVAIGISVARNLIGWQPTALPSTTYESSDLPNTLTTGNTVTVVGGALDGQTFSYIGDTIAGKVIFLNREDYTDTSTWTDLGTGGSHTYTTDSTPETLHHNDTVEVLSGPLAGHRFQYRGTTTGAADRQIDLSTVSYDDVTQWAQVGMTPATGQVQAYSETTSIHSSGALSIMSSETSSIDALVLAVSVAVAGGGDLAVGVSAGGVYTQNKIANDVRAYVSGSGTDGISVSSATITATDSAGIRVLAGAASVAAAIGGDAAVSVSIGLSIALNEVSGAVAAFVTGADDFSTGTGAIQITATESGLAVNDTSTHNQLDVATYGVSGAALDALTLKNTENQQSDPSLATLRAALAHGDALPPIHLGDEDYTDTSNWQDLGTGVSHTYTTQDTPRTIVQGDTVEVLGGAHDGHVYRYLGTGIPKLSVSALDGSDPGVTPTSSGKTWEITVDGGPTLIVTTVDSHLLVSRATIDAVAFAASLAAAFGEVAVAVSGAGAVAFNDVTTQANAYIDSSSVTHAGTVTLQATSTAAITATIVAFSVALAGGEAGVGVSIGLSIAQNRIGTPAAPAQVRAYIHDSSVVATGELRLMATSSETIGALVIAASAAIAGGEVGIGASGAGVSATNSILVDTEAYIACSITAGVNDCTGDDGVSAPSIELNAQDNSTIQAMAGAATLAIGFGEVGVAFSIGVSLAENDIASVVEASISNVPSVSATSGDLTLTAFEGASINAVTWAASVALGAGVAALALSGAGASAYNDITTHTNAFIASSSITHAAAVTIKASDGSSITAVVAAVSAALAFGGAGGAGSIGVALARNMIGFAPDPNATHTYTTDQAAMPASLQDGDIILVKSGPRAGELYRYSGPTRTALSFQNFDDTSIWQDQPGVTTATYTLGDMPATIHHNDTVQANGHVYKYLPSADLTPVVDLSAMDYGTRTMWTQVGLTSSPLEVQAYISQSSISATGALTLLALSNQTINATDVAASAAIAIGAGGVALTGAGAATENKVYDQVRAFIDGSGTSGISAASVLLSAEDTSSITVFTGAFSLAVAVGPPSLAVSVSIGVALAENDISNDVEAFIANASSGVTATSGPIVVNATESASITSTTIAASVAASWGAIAIAAAGAGANALNVINTTTAAHVDASVLASSGGVTLSASTPSALTIHAIVVAAAASLAGGVVAAGAALGVALAQNLIGWHSDGSAGSANVEAYVVNSSIDTGGALRVTATAAATITAEMVSGAVAIVGGVVGIGLAGAGVHVVNKIAMHVEAYIEGDGANGIYAAAVSLAARDTSSITANALGVAVAAAFGALGFGLSIGVSIAENDISNRVFSCIEGVDGAANTTDAPCADGTTETGTDSAVNTDPRHTTAETSAALQPGDRVLVQPGYAHGGVAGTTYRYTGSATTLDLSTQDYTGASWSVAHTWTPVASVAGLDLAQHSTTDGSVALQPGDLVSVPTGYAGGGSAGLYRYLGAAATRDLGIQDYSLATLWAAVAVGDLHRSADGTVAVVPGDLVSNSTGLYRYVGTPGTVALNIQDFTATGSWAPVAVGDISVTAGESATIDATAQAIAVAAAVGLVGISLAGAGANAQNVILTNTGAHVVSATLASGGGVAVMASNSGGITAHVTAAAVAASFGLISVGVAVGTSISRNFIGFDPQGTTVSSPSHTSDSKAILTHNDTVRIVSGVRAGDVYKYIGVTTSTAVDLSAQDYGDTSKWQLFGISARGALADAYLSNAGVTAAGELRVTSDSAQSISATIDAISVAVAVGLFSDAGAGAGVDVVNSIGAGSSAYVSGSRGSGVTAGHAVIRARDSSGITATALAAAVAAQIGWEGGAIAVGIALASNDIANQVQAYVDGATLTTTSGGATIESLETVTANSTHATAAAVSVSISQDGALSVAGADADSTTESSSAAYVNNSTLSIAGALVLHADGNASSTTAVVSTTSASVGFVAFAFTAKPETTADSSPTVSAYLSGSDVTAGNDIDLTATAETGATATTTGSSFTVGITGSSDVGVSATAEATPTVSAYTSGSGSHTTSTHGAITIVATHDLDPTNLTQTGGVATATANASGIAVSIAPGTASTTANATETPNITSSAAGTLSAATTVTIEAESANSSSAHADGSGGGFVGIGASHATATDNGTTAAHLDGSVGTGTAAGAANLEITATSTDLASAISDASGKGVVGTIDNSSSAIATPTVSAYLGTGAGASVSSNVELLATESPEADATTHGTSAGAGAFGSSDSNVTDSPSVNAYFGASSTVNAGGLISITATLTPAGGVAPPPYVINSVDASNNTLNVPNNGLTNGDVVSYSNGGGIDIGGAPSQSQQCSETGTTPPCTGSGNDVVSVTRDYNVVNYIRSDGSVDPNNISLGASFDGQACPGSTQSCVNGSNDTISFDQAHNLLTGDAVQYVPGHASATVGGLNTTNTYYVVVIDDRTIRLVASQNQATDPAAFYQQFLPSNISGTTITGNGFTNDGYYTYHAPTPSSFTNAVVDINGGDSTGSAVDLRDNAAADNIVFVDPTTGDLVHSPFANGASILYQVSPGGTAIGGLTDGTIYRVVFNSSHPNQIQLKFNDTNSSLSVDFVDSGPRRSDHSQRLAELGRQRLWARSDLVHLGQPDQP